MDFQSVSYLSAATSRIALMLRPDHSTEIAEKVREFVEKIVKLDEISNDTDNVGNFSLAHKRLSGATTGSSRSTSITK
jgi:hypothetical protein